MCVTTGPPSGGTLSVTHRRTYPLNPSPPALDPFPEATSGTGLPTAVRKNQPLVPQSNFGGKVCARTDPWFRSQTLPVPGHGGGGYVGGALYIWRSIARQGCPPAGPNSELMVCSSARISEC